VQIELGLLEERLTPRRPPQCLTRINQRRSSQAGQPARPVTAGEKARKRRKAEKQVAASATAAETPLDNGSTGA
jgi:hypothetical protein